MATYMGRNPDSTDAQVSDNVRTFVQDGQPMVRGSVKANWPMGFGYRDLDLTADQAEALGLAFIRAAERSRAQVAAAAADQASRSSRQVTWEANIKFYLSLGYTDAAICEAMDIAPSVLRGSLAYKVHHVQAVSA